MNEIIMRTKNLTKQYGKQIAVNNVNMEIEKGEIYGLVGKNGAGKTTIMKMISGLIMPNNGEIELFDRTSPKDLSKGRMRTGVMIETPSFFPYLSAEKNLEYYRIQRGIAGKDIINEVLEAVGLSNTGKKKFKSFSLGMKQRLGLALAIMGDPDFLILDEPINGLDPAGIVEFREILLKLNREKNVTVLISSHILSELSQLATTYCFIDDGKIIEEIKAKTLDESCKHHLLVKVDNAQKAVVVLEEKLKCKEYEMVNDNEIKIFKYMDTPEVIAPVFVENKIKLLGLSQVGVNLENYFIDLIGGKTNA